MLFVQTSTLTSEHAPKTYRKWKLLSAKQPTPTKSYVELKNNCTCEFGLFIISCFTNFMLLHMAFKVCSPLLVKSLHNKVENFLFDERFFVASPGFGIHGSAWVFLWPSARWNGNDRNSSLHIQHRSCSLFMHIYTSNYHKCNQQRWPATLDYQQYQRIQARQILLVAFIVEPHKLHGLFGSVHLVHIQDNREECAAPQGCPWRSSYCGISHLILKNVPERLAWFSTANIAPPVIQRKGRTYP